ncbi:hypothetical protein STRIP9103_04277 [Streptomyces ipomoeae 91-03]|uniref:Uncharacterized protein n=1 Tax=Streptomyces ipomoeae 91-03 TaxID=698759 RepID=L1KJN1_9ACTN|nr:hypothetical protein STRIP9103_04277 [Streptomyces ipomoeae 91-03]
MRKGAVRWCGGCAPLFIGPPGRVFRGAGNRATGHDVPALAETTLPPGCQAFSSPAN